jgi:hypothetical protein
MKITKDRLKVLIKEELKTLAVEQTENPYQTEIDRLYDIISEKAGEIARLKSSLQDAVYLLEQQPLDKYQLDALNKIKIALESVK